MVQTPVNMQLNTNINRYVTNYVDTQCLLMTTVVHVLKYYVMQRKYKIHMRFALLYYDKYLFNRLTTLLHKNVLVPLFF